MRYPPTLLDEIRSRISVSRVVERRVKLKRIGREYSGLSPFKTERTPSFTVNDQKGFYHCFASGEHGDIFTFLMKTEGLTFPEAVEKLASEAGVVLPEEKSHLMGESQAHENRLKDACEAACRFYQNTLQNSNAQQARDYFARRGIEERDIETFRLGFAPDQKTALKSHLLALGFTLHELQDAGLVVYGEGIPIPYDRFRGRLMFPIVDAKGNVIAFGGRALQQDQQPKYLNSPETPLFQKGKTLYNFKGAKAAARASKSVFVAEGYMDVIALARAGYENAVAPLGTALTQEQLLLLWTISPSPSLCFDGDAAGRKAAFRVVDVALPLLEPQRTLRCVFLPDGQDPDDIMRNGGAAALADVTGRTTEFFDLLWMREEARHLIQTPEQWANFENRLMVLVNGIQHKTLRFNYIAAVRQRLKERRGKFSSSSSPAYDWRARSSLFEGKGRFPQNRSDRHIRTQSLSSSVLLRPSFHDGYQREALILKALINHHWLLEDYAEDVAVLVFTTSDCQIIQKELLALNHETLGENKTVLEVLKDRGFSDTLTNIFSVLTHSADRNFEPQAEKSEVLEGWNHLMGIHRQSLAAIRDLKEAELDHFKDQTGETFAKIFAIRQQVQAPLS